MSSVADVSSMARVPTIYNVTMTLANTEYSQTLPLRTKKYLIHTRDESLFRLAFVSGKVAASTAPFFTVLASSRYYEDMINNEYPAASLLTLYFASPDAGKIIEIIAWT